ncbi:MAG: TetR/AcrR family transcriptional regulator [Cytophagales bacterium]|nr:TetR/AcrR family transcriptional regulator [Cytophagales bacterium]
MNNMLSEKQLKIRNTALELFSLKGCQSTTIEEIASTCEVAKGLLFYYYETKDQLIQDIVEESTGEVLNRFKPFDTPSDMVELRVLFQNLMKILEFNPQFWKLTFQIMVGATQYPQPYTFIRQKLDKPLHDKVFAYFKNRNATDPLSETAMFTALVNGAYFNILFRDLKAGHYYIRHIEKLFGNNKVKEDKNG